ncbi:aldose 1-epimerase family protein [Nitriliruptoraceae bacterium ZYF776]|nr:aldose 1-epimerase family protein [Profundirhabdus halotolerans]
MSRGGAEHELRSGPYRASVTEVGAGVRSLTADGRDLVVPYAAGAVRPLARGSLLIPWPNRIADGRYRFDDVAHQLPLNEPDRRCALHGLLLDVRSETVRASADEVVLTHRLVPRPGYPFDLEVQVHYRLDDDGLHTQVRARNVGTARAPYGVGPHPYLRGGRGRVDDWSVQVPAGTIIEVDERLLPEATVAAAGHALDLRDRRTLAGLEIDHCYGALEARTDGHVEVSVLDADGVGATCRWDPAVLPWVQVHTADRPEPDAHRVGLAIEPMTCPPDAFNSGVDLAVLEPGEEHTATWTIAAVG